jgi:hypothetical protein
VDGKGEALMGIFSSDRKSNTSTNYADNSQDDLSTVAGGAGSFAMGQGATFNGIDPQSLAVIEAHQSDGLKFMAQLGTDTLQSLAGSVTNVIDKSGANMAQAWSHQVDTMGETIGGLTAAAKANSDAGQVVATAALKANANAGDTISNVFKWGALALAAVFIGRTFMKGRA